MIWLGRIRVEGCDGRLKPPPDAIAHHCIAKRFRDCEPKPRALDSGWSSQLWRFSARLGFQRKALTGPARTTSKPQELSAFFEGLQLHVKKPWLTPAKAPDCSN